MAIQSCFFDAVLTDGVYDRVYNSGDFSSYLDGIVGSGVLPNPSTNLQVRASSPASMSVVVGEGSGWIKGHKMINTADLSVSIDAADSVLNRIDYVIFFLDMSSRTMGIGVRKGTPAASPAAPVLARTANRQEYALAQINVTHGLTSIGASKIVDVRMSSALCGFVQGLIQQVSTETLWQQQQAAFNEWFADVQQQLVSGKRFKKLDYVGTLTGRTFNITTYIPTYSYVYDILEIYINGLHVATNEYTQSGATVTLNTSIGASSNVEFVVYKSVDEE